MEYFFELRKRFLKCFLLTIILFITLSFFANPLYSLLTRPLILQLPSAHLISTSITAPFLVPMKFVLMLSIFVLIPFFFYQGWAFVAPALYPKERKITWLLLIPSVILFYVGLIFAYFLVLPMVFRFFIHTTPKHVELLPDIAQYLSFALQMMFAFGFAFEVPILVMVLVNFNVVSIKQLKAARRYVVVGAFVIAMIITPPDVLSQILLAIPLWLLYELGLLLSVLLHRKKASLTTDVTP